MGVSKVVGTGRIRFRGGEEEGSTIIGQRGGDKKEEGNYPGNNNRPGMMVGVQSINLTYYMYSI